MRYLAFRKISTGEWTNALFTTAGSSFTPAETESRRLAVAAALGVPETDLEAVARATDPRSGTYLALPVAPPSPQDEARDRALAAIAANKDIAPWGRILHDLAIADGLIEA